MIEEFISIFKKIDEEKVKITPKNTFLELFRFYNSYEEYEKILNKLETDSITLEKLKSFSD